MSRFTDATMISVQVETSRESVWVPDGMVDVTYPAGGIVLNDLLALPRDTELRPVTSPMVGVGVHHSPRQDIPVTDVDAEIELDVDYEGFGSDRMVKDVSATVKTDASTARSLGPVVVQTRMPIPVKPGDQVSFSGDFGIRKPGERARLENGSETGVAVRVSVWGLSSNADEYGVVNESAVELLSYQSTIQGVSAFGPGWGQTSHSLPVVSPAVVPAGVSSVHFTVTLLSTSTGEWLSARYKAEQNGKIYIPRVSQNLFTLSTAAPFRLTVVPLPPAAPGAPAAQWQTRTQEQNRLWRWTYEDITDHVVRLTTERIEADLAVHSIRLHSTTVPNKVKAGRRVRIVALHSDGAFTVIAAGTIRTRRIVHDGRHEAQVEIGVHDSHGKLMSTTARVAFDTLSEYAPILNSLGIEATIDGVEVTGPSRELPEWGGAFPSYRAEGLTVWESLIMARNARKAFVRLTRTDRLEVLSALPDATVLDLSDVPGQGDMSYAVDAEFGSDSAELINSVRVEEYLLDSSDFTERFTGTGDPPQQFGAIAGRTQTAEYRRPSSVDAYGLASRTFPVVRGSGAWADIVAGNYGTNFAAWAAPLLDDFSTEYDGPRAVTIPITTEAQRRAVAALEVLDAVVVRFRGVAQVRHIRQLSHSIQPGRWTVSLRFDTKGEQAYWQPTVTVPATGPGVLKPYVPNPKGPTMPIYDAVSGVDGGEVDPALSGTLDGGDPWPATVRPDYNPHARGITVATVGVDGGIPSPQLSGSQDGGTP